MKHYLLFFLALFLWGCGGSSHEENSYLIVAQKSIEADAEWSKVVDALRNKHKASVVYFEGSPREAILEIKSNRPRYIAFVDRPENIGRDYIMDLHRMSRTIDDDIFADYLWGVITGYDAQAALNMVNNSTEPLRPKSSVVTIMEMNSGKWFDRFGFVDDHTKGLWGEKGAFEDTVTTEMLDPNLILAKFYDLYIKYDPDLVVTAAHADERRLEMPFSLGAIDCRDGQLYTNYNYRRGNDTISRFRYFDGNTDPQPMVESGKRKVYFAVGNCLIGNMNNTKESMAAAWMNGSNAATMIGYVVTTWHGRNGWGGLKYWVTNPGRYSLAEAIYLNQQDFLYQQSQWSPGFLSVEYPFDNGGFREAATILKEGAGIEEPTFDQIGFLHDRDVLAFYGDPKWDVRLQEVPGETDFSVSWKIRKNQCVITIKTEENFSLERMVGDKFKEEHVLDIPFSYFFPKRLNNPRLAEGERWNAVVDENFLFIYDPCFEAGQTYTITLEIN